MARSVRSCHMCHKRFVCHGGRTSSRGGAPATTTASAVAKITTNTNPQAKEVSCCNTCKNTNLGTLKEPPKTTMIEESSSRPISEVTATTMRIQQDKEEKEHVVTKETPTINNCKTETTHQLRNVNKSTIESQDWKDDDETLHHAITVNATDTDPTKIVQQIAVSTSTSDTGPESSSSFSSSIGCKSDDICFICGTDLSKVKHRINHIKRCSKKYSISGKDVRIGGDEDNFQDQENVTEPSLKESDVGFATVVSTSSEDSDSQKRYQKERDWHGDATALLKITNQHHVPNHPKQQTQTTLAKFVTIPARNLNNVLMAASRKISKVNQVISEEQCQQQNTKKRGSENHQGSSSTKVINVSKRGRFNKRPNPQGQGLSSYKCPQYKKIPGTDFVVDGFHYAKQSLTENYFLTHFHSDHYGGIDSKWNAGTIYCSLPTANLVHQQLGVDKTYLHPLPLDTDTIVASRGAPVTVTLLDANHCPGAVMILFTVGKRKILHVGDFRWDREVMLQKSPLRDIALNKTQLDELFLDTTYCDPKYALPSQLDTVQAVIELFQLQRDRNKRTLHLFGAYTIGKERIFLSVAEHFGMKVYVDTSRYRILAALEWPKDRMRLLTTNKEESCIWVVPLGHINMKRMPDYFQIANNKPFAPQYNEIVGYRPTGWSFSSKPSAGIVSSRKSGKLTIHGLPYSEHSSFPELVDCLACLRPGRIVPTVNAAKSQEQVETLLKGLRTKQTEIRLCSGSSAKCDK